MFPNRNYRFYGNNTRKHDEKILCFLLAEQLLLLVPTWDHEGEHSTNQTHKSTAIKGL